MSGFRFKQFYIHHHQCAMKVGTDGILLGAWASHTSCQRILDLGTGSGLIAIMLAQRYPEADIIGVERDPLSAQQATANAQQSPWANRIHMVQQDVETFVQQWQKTQQQFDLIVANPPYFTKGIDCTSEARNLARYQQQSHFNWLQLAETCLHPNGKICFILPFDAANHLKIQAKHTALQCIEQCNIITKQGKAPSRMLLSFSTINLTQTEQTLVIYDENNQYTEAYKKLTKEFYLNL